MPEKAWAYYSSAADDEITNRENHLAYHRYNHLVPPRRYVMLTTSRIWFRPRVLRDVSKVDWSTTILGHGSSMPVYIVQLALYLIFLPLTSLLDRPQRRSASWVMWMGN